MKTVIDATQEVLLKSDIALEAMRAGVLNLSAFAEQILPEVEQLTWKTVKKNTVVVALARLANELEQQPSLHPEVRINELSIKSPLADITYERTTANLDAAHQLSAVLGLQANQFLTVTQGITEITIIVSQEKLADVEAHMNVASKSIFRDLVGVTMKFGEEYLPQPNVIYALLAKLAHQRISLYEIVSTYTELTVFISEKDLQTAVSVMSHSSK